MVFDGGHEDSLGRHVDAEMIDTALYIWKRDARIKRQHLGVLPGRNAKRNHQGYKNMRDRPRCLPRLLTRTVQADYSGCGNVDHWFLCKLYWTACQINLNAPCKPTIFEWSGLNNCRALGVPEWHLIWHTGFFHVADLRSKA